MDSRKKQIIELERHKNEQAALLDMLLSGFGETLFGRIVDSTHKDVVSLDEKTAYLRFQDDIADSESSIHAVEEQIRRFRELEEGIEANERDGIACQKDLAGMYGSLGKLLLGASIDDGPGYVDFCAPYRDQAEALATKIHSLEDRLDGLENNEKGNVFTWIGKNTQTLVLRSFLNKAEDSLEQIRRNVGERYSRSDFSAVTDKSKDKKLRRTVVSAEVATLCGEIEHKRAESRDLAQDLDSMKEEKREISGSFNTEGSPLKQIQSIKAHIANVRDELNAMYKRIGAEAAGIDLSEGKEQVKRTKLFNSLIRPDDTETLTSAAQICESIKDAQISIEKLKASLAIDDEKAKISKYHKMILERKEKIAQAEKNIAEYESGIKDSEANIEKLQKLL